MTMKRKYPNELLVGSMLLILGLIIISMNATVSFYGFYFFRSRISGGITLIPLFVGIVMLVVMQEKKWGKIVTAVSIAAILISLVLSMNIHIRTTNLFSVLVMFIPVLVGVGLMVRGYMRRDEA